eukprot:12220423-Alexandrium_andersonii.AAC.1
MRRGLKRPQGCCAPTAEASQAVLAPLPTRALASGIRSAKSCCKGGGGRARGCQSGPDRQAL